MHVCMYTHIMHVCIYTHISVFEYFYACMHACMNIRMYVCIGTHVSIQESISMYICVYECHVCVCVCIGVFVYKCVIWQLERLDAQSRSDLWGLLYGLLLSWPLLHQILVDRSNYINRFSGASEKVNHLNVTNCII